MSCAICAGLKFTDEYCYAQPESTYVGTDLMPRRKRSRSQDFMPEASGDLKRQKSASVQRPGAQPDPSSSHMNLLANNSFVLLVASTILNE